MSLTGRQEVFAVAVGKGLSQSDAYRQAYPKSLKWKQTAVHERASRLAANAKVSARIAEVRSIIVDATALEANRILRELGRLAASDIGRVIDETGRIKLPHELDPETRAAVASFEIDEMGRVKYKFWDKNAAIDKAMKHLGLFEADNKQKPAEIRRIELVPLGAAPGAGVPQDERDGST